MEIRRYYDHLISTIQPSYLHSWISSTDRWHLYIKSGRSRSLIISEYTFLLILSAKFNFNILYADMRGCTQINLSCFFTRETYQWSQSVVVATGTLPYICMVSRCELYPCKVGCYYRYLSNPPRLLNPRMTMSRMKSFLHVLSES